jgi:hypothetical protein
MRLKKLWATSLILVVLGGCDRPQPQPNAPTYTPPVDTRMSTAEMSKRLSVGMPEAAVIAMREPDRIGQQTCGQTSGAGSWNCRILYYGGTFMVILAQRNGGWVVNGWN